MKMREVMNDLSVEILKDLWKYSKSDRFSEKQIRAAIDYAILVINMSQRWIPCTEKLPEVGDTYLVTVTYKGEVLAVDAACFGPDCHYIDDMWATYNDWIEDNPELYHVTAWMPLPDAYEGVKE